MVDWTTIKRFAPLELTPPGLAPNDINMHPDFLRKFDEFAQGYHSHQYFIVHKNGGYSFTGHSENSLHYKGLAVDFHVSLAAPLEVMLRAWKDTKFSIGYYPHWNNPGFHFDGRYHQGDTRNYWYKDRFGAYHYFLAFDGFLEGLSLYLGGGFR